MKLLHTILAPVIIMINFSGGGNTDYKRELEISVEIQDTIYRYQKNVPITMIIYNSSNTSIILRDPSIYNNSYPSIFKGEKLIWTAHPKPIINIAESSKLILQPKETVRRTFTFPLDQIMSLCTGETGEYMIYFRVYPDKDITHMIKSRIAWFTLID